MKEQELEKIRKEYLKSIKSKERLFELKEKISLLEQDKHVVKYLQLIEIYNKFIKINQGEKYVKSNEDLLIDSMVNNPITKTNNIYVDMGIFSLKSGKLYRKYRNIELLSNQDGYEKKIFKEEIKSFEKENIIINLPFEKRDDKNYLKIKEQFYIDSINNGQEIAIKKILSMND